MIKTPRKLLADLGGPHAVAAKLAVENYVVRMWSSRNVIPRKSWPDIILTYPEVSQEQLLEAEGHGGREAKLLSGEGESTTSEAA